MSKTFAEYEEEYQSCLNRIRSVLAKTPRSSNHIQDCQEWLSVARSAAIAMQGLAEVQGDYVTIQQAQERFDKDLTPLQMELARGSVTENEQDPLFYRQVDLEQQGMYDTEALLQSSHALLLESQALVSDTEYIGMNTLTQMSQQREQLYIASNHLEGTTYAVQQAGIMLRNMRDKVWRNKMALQFIVVVLILLNGGVVVLIWKKKHHSH